MSKNISQFKFKQFSVSHYRSSMKVGVDGVLIGCWTDVEGSTKILDVGSGCGLITLMMAQRCPEADIIGIDIDEPSCTEALENAKNSPWKDRINIINGDFPDILNIEYSKGFDLIVSNPPYFDSGISNIATSRERARHQGSLSPFSLLASSVALLTPSGTLAMIVPTEFTSSLEEEANKLGYILKRKCFVRGHAEAPYKRVLLQWILKNDVLYLDETKIEHLTLESERGKPTDEYRQLCKDFYLKF